jgi:hypothetical protein
MSAFLQRYDFSRSAITRSYTVETEKKPLFPKICGFTQENHILSTKLPQPYPLPTIHFQE